MGFEFRILGPLEVARDGEAVRLGGRKQRSLLALLALQPGEPAAPDRLMIALALEVSYQGAVQFCLEGIAAVHAARGEAERAAALLGAAEVAAADSGMSLEPFEQEVHDRTVVATRAALGDTYDDAVAAGRGLDVRAI